MVFEYDTPISIHAPRAGRDAEPSTLSGFPCYFNPRAPCGARRASTSWASRSANFNPRAPCGARRPGPGRDLRLRDFNPRAPCGARLASRPGHGSDDDPFQSTRPVRGATRPVSQSTWFQRFQSTRPVRGATAEAPVRVHAAHISIHAPRAGRDLHTACTGGPGWYFNPRAPCGARLGGAGKETLTNEHFNPRAPCGARLSAWIFQPARRYFNPRAPCGARPEPRRRGAVCRPISIHAPRAGRDSKSIQNYFTHFCDKRQFLDNFTQNAAF